MHAILGLLFFNTQYMFDLLMTPFAGILGLVHLIVFIWALLQILGSSMNPLKKILWILIVALFPVIGLLLWILIGNK